MTSPEPRDHEELGEHLMVGAGVRLAVAADEHPVEHHETGRVRELDLVHQLGTVGLESWLLAEK